MKTPNEILSFCVQLVQTQMQDQLSFPMHILLFTDTVVYPLNLSGAESDNDAKYFFGQFVRWSVPQKAIKAVAHVTEAWTLDPAKSKHYTQEQIRQIQALPTLEGHPDVIEVAMIQVETETHLGMQAFRLKRHPETDLIEDFEPVDEMCSLLEKDKEDSFHVRGRLADFFSAPDDDFMAQPGLAEHFRGMWAQIPDGVPLDDFGFKNH